MLGIDVDGSIYPCEEMNGKRELIVGNILQDDLDKILNSDLNKTLRRRKIEDLEDCVNCSIQTVCEVTCANHSYNESRNFNTKTEKCEYYKVMFPGLMWRIHDDFEGMLTLL